MERDPFEPDPDDNPFKLDDVPEEDDDTEVIDPLDAAHDALGNACAIEASLADHPETLGDHLALMRAATDLAAASALVSIADSLAMMSVQTGPRAVTVTNTYSPPVIPSAGLPLGEVARFS